VPWSAATVVDAQAPPGNKALADLGTQLLDTIDDLHRLVVSAEVTLGSDRQDSDAAIFARALAVTSR
jgi:hypothetical protein